MNKWLAMVLAVTATSVSASEMTRQQYSELFKNYNGCFILYSLNEHKILTEFNPKNRCTQRIAADSTFKIALSLMAFNHGVINQNSTFKWDGKQRKMTEWNQDQTPNTWIKNSVVWVSQQLSKQLGAARIKHYLAGFNYGNQDFSGDYGKNNGLTHAWLSSSLKISAKEQLQFLTAMLSGELPISNEALANTKKNLYQGKLANGADYYGKTGSGINKRNGRNVASKLRDGWFVGFIENGNQQYIFVSNITDKFKPVASDKAYGNQILKPITMKILNDYFSTQS